MKSSRKRETVTRTMVHSLLQRRTVITTDQKSAFMDRMLDVGEIYPLDSQQ